MVLVATTTPDEIMPNAAPMVARALGATGAGAFDVGGACAGFLTALATGAAMVDSRRADCVVVIGADFMSRVVDPQDRGTAAVFADGAGAVVLVATGESRIGPIVLGSEGDTDKVIRVERSDQLIRMAGHETFKIAVAKLSEATEQALTAAGLGLDEIDLFVYHQANARILTAVGERLGLKSDRVVDCIEDLGTPRRRRCRSHSTTASRPAACATVTACCSRPSAVASSGAQRLSNGACHDELGAYKTEVDTLTPIQRLETLCDAGSLDVIRSEVVSSHMGLKARAGDGVVGGAGLVDGRPVFCYAQDNSYVGGSLGEAHAATIVRVMELADRARAPVVGFVGSGGARMQEGVRALGGYGRIFRQTVALSGKVPQISVISGLSAGGGAYSPALTDWVVMTEGASMFLTGPGVVKEALGEDVTAAELGGHRVHERNGVAHFVAPHRSRRSTARPRPARLPAEPPRPAIADACVHAPPARSIPRCMSQTTHVRSMTSAP